MKAVRIVCAALALLCLSACGNSAASPNEPITLFPPHSEQQTSAAAEVQTTRNAYDQTETAQTRLASANDTYGETKTLDAVGKTKDASLTCRTSDSYAFEEDAAAAAKALFAETLLSPDSLSVTNTQILDCADDGDCVYYRVYMDAAYRVQTGEQMRRGVFQSVGIRKSDRLSFDASEQMRDVLEKYSAFAQEMRGSSVPVQSGEPDYAQAAQEIARKQLKEPSTGTVLHCERNDAQSERCACEAYDVQCEGVNSYRMRIPDVYTVYMVYENDSIQQIDPNA